jgi:hypothetical protein
MSINRFLKDLTNTVAGRSERRLGRKLGRLLGLKIREPEHGQPEATPNPLPASEAPTKPDPARSKPPNDSYQRGHADGKAWGFNRAFRSDLERLAKWAAGVGKYSGLMVAAVICPKPSEWTKADAEKLTRGDADYAAGFVAGALEVWQHQLVAEAKAEAKI